MTRKSPNSTETSDLNSPDLTLRAPQKPISEKGAVVAAGKDWVTGLTHEHRVAHMENHENSWKQIFNKRGIGRQGFKKG
jgi:hypothetical protein